MKPRNASTAMSPSIQTLLDHFQDSPSLAKQASASAKAFASNPQLLALHAAWTRSVAASNNDLESAEYANAMATDGLPRSILPRHLSRNFLAYGKTNRVVKGGHAKPKPDLVVTALTVQVADLTTQGIDIVAEIKPHEPSQAVPEEPSTMDVGNQETDTSRKRPLSEIMGSSRSKKARVEVRRLTKDELQLVSYDTEALSAGHPRHFVFGPYIVRSVLYLHLYTRDQIIISRPIEHPYRSRHLYSPPPRRFPIPQERTWACHPHPWPARLPFPGHRHSLECCRCHPRAYPVHS
ncbi:hypothetical protein CALVIDRAFT_361142 [Calocera viscosa TUFC12733]|uniref:Uncharacterized protein n=1 Tax=Calocera viscosa (strain TUFC12733) TaxID=1330018 RepID=A0A167H6N3_CALVF|nr:hypothetical protein CALVIDRAFT_361142 [Calocera viscosa TUFC12733]